MDKVIQEIVEERKRQKEVEGWTPEHDDEHVYSEMVLAAACYAVNGGRYPGFAHGKIPEIYCKKEYVSGIEFKSLWPWDKQWDKREKHDEKRSLIIAASLIVAELERLERRENGKSTV